MQHTVHPTTTAVYVMFEYNKYWMIILQNVLKKREEKKNTQQRTTHCSVFVLFGNSTYVHLDIKFMKLYSSLLLFNILKIHCARIHLVDCIKVAALDKWEIFNDIQNQ